MKQQVLVIHGGNAFDSYEEYIADLRAKEVTLERLTAKDWKVALGERLGSAFEVFTPRMPNGQNAKYLEWKIYFEKLLPLMDDGVVLVGHSLGGIFLAKYLSEETVSKKIRATLFVAAPFNTAEIHPYADFNLTEPIERLAEQGGQLFFYQSKDDQVVPYSNVKDYQKRLPDAHFTLVDGRGHFNDATFPELEETLRTL
jgi:predicted alpha/beta hydrolase family esterase